MLVFSKFNRAEAVLLTLMKFVAPAASFKAWLWSCCSVGQAAVTNLLDIYPVDLSRDCLVPFMGTTPWHTTLESIHQLQGICNLGKAHDGFKVKVRHTYGCSAQSVISSLDKESQYVEQASLWPVPTCRVWLEFCLAQKRPPSLQLAELSQGATEQIVLSIHQ